MFKELVSNGIFLLCILLCFVFSLISYINISSSDYFYITGISRNWAYGPISEVEASSYDCNSDKVSLINDFWEGTVQGCVCSAIINDGLYRGICNRKSYGCSGVFPNSPMPYKIWKSTHFCSKRGPSYLDLKIAKTESECGSNYKSCGIIDSLNQVLCYPDNVKCPYNYVNALEPNDSIPTDRKYDVVNIGFNGQEGKFIFSNENTRGKIINQFSIDDDVPCVSPDYKHLSYIPYYLEKSYDKGKCTNDIGGELYDNSYTKLDSESYSRLYHENQIMGILMSLPQFQKYNYLNNQTSLFYKNYIGIDRKCISRLLGGKTSSEIFQEFSEMEKIIISSSTLALVGLICSCIGIFVIIILACIFCTGGPDGMKAFYIVAFIFFTLPAFIISAILIRKTNAINYDLGIIADPTCSDKITSSAVNFFSSKISSGVSMATGYLVCSIIGIIFNIAVCIM